jgi:disulfide bond formation protein DsbB
MSTDTVTTFLALLAVLALTVVVVSAVVSLWSLARGVVPRWAFETRAAVAPVALPLAWAVATTCTLGSLYLSEVAKFPPCILCWYQRIAMYPLVVILAVAALRRDRQVSWYVVPIAVLGMGISIYHYLIERFPDSVSFSCSADVPCSTVWVWKFHFLSIPAMAGIGFALIITLVLLGRSSGPRDVSGTPRGSLDDAEIDPGDASGPRNAQESTA